jgi:hypothetical protein
MAMNGAQVVQVEGAAGHVPADAEGHKDSLLLIEKDRIGGPKPISQD